MITNEEINAVKLSATKKDFYQIWNELLTTASKISERWDPQSTNESDPGIVLLKVLTAVADKLNYNIDVNSLEAFMPSAAQEESMRKLCDMLGYNMKYYRSAETEVQIGYNKSASDIPAGTEIRIDRFTNIKDVDDTINYVTTEDIFLSADMPSQLVPCIEGQLVECETDDDNIVSLLQLDDNNRYYLPEVQIAENGIFITNVDNNSESGKWEVVYNLNTQPIGKHCYKFGFDSRVNLPYIQFPDDISNIIEDGLKIKYIRTNGINGNISAKTLCKLDKPLSWQTSSENTSADYFDTKNYSVSNPSAAKNGCNNESLTDAYNSYKKTIGTFDTLVTCRDYMNKIYQMTESQIDSTPLVSNIIVSDIRDDINKAAVLCTIGEYGIEYNNISKDLSDDDLITVTETDWNNDYVGQATIDNLDKVYKIVDDNDNTKVKGYFVGISNGVNYTFAKCDPKAINNFDLVLYPFTTIYGLNTKGEYTKSFKYDNSNLLAIKEQLENYKTLSHNIVSPGSNDIACIKNYYNLKTSITTTRKVNAIEQASILNNVYSKLYETFNMRKVDFGEELNEDYIKDIIKSADARIKDTSEVSSELITKFCTVAGGEFGLSDTAGKVKYNKLVLNNVLAGRVPLFNYDENFKPEFNEIDYQVWGASSDEKYDLLYPTVINSEKTNGIATVKTAFHVGAEARDLKILSNEVIQFRLPNLKTEKTYPAFVNYYVHLTPNEHNRKAVPATMYSLAEYLDSDATHALWEEAATKFSNLPSYLPNDEAAFESLKANKHALFTLVDTVYTYAETYTENTRYYYLILEENNIAIWKNWLATKGLEFYYNKGVNMSASYGYLVDKLHRQFLIINIWRPATDPFSTYFVPHTWDSDLIDEGQPENWHLANGLGQDADINGIEANSEYQLKAGEYILFNYTHAASTEGEEKTVVNDCYKTGDIIKANFDLKDSAENRSLHKYSKTDGYDFTGYGIANPDGMFTLGTNEQIEKRAFVRVTLDGFTNLYWEVKNETVGANDRIVFPWNETPVGEINGQPFYTEYTLKDGEYLYYTNRDKTNIAYYGAGTKITRTRNTPEIFKTRFDATISAEDVAELGISAAIPWRPYDLSKDGDNVKALTLTEYQYINLASGSVLKDFEIDSDEINNDWQPCEDATYSLDGETVIQLSKVSFIGNESWDVRSRLELNVSPTTAQQLHGSVPTENGNLAYAYDEVKLFDKDNTSIVLADQDEHGVGRIRPHNSNTVSIKANKIIQSTTDSTFVGYIEILDTETFATYYDCQLKVFSLETLRDANNSPINLNNFGEGNFTKLSFDSTDNETGDRAFAILNATIPAGHFGLLTIQNNKIGTSTKTVAIRTIPADGSGVGSLTNPIIYNCGTEWPYDKNDEADLWATEHINYNDFTDDGAVSDDIAEARFTSIKNTLYIKRQTERPAETPGAKKLHTYELVGNNINYYIYTKVTDEAWTKGSVYCQLLDEGGIDTIYYLTNGINVIQLDNSCTLQIFPDPENLDTILFSGLDLIYDDAPINPKLCYKVLDGDETPLAVAEQILADIKKIDVNNKFYYNAIMNNETALDLNPLDPEDTLENPVNWYRYNNINNKFVVSEINANYLPIGITISKNSKL